MKPDEDRKTNVLRIRLKEHDRKLLEAVAKYEGEDCSTWARDVLLRVAKRRLGPIETTWTEGH
jgi:uncharacterized protein (DUF1778 family)